jgi:acyl-CoA thioester hydrolase
MQHVSRSELRVRYSETDQMGVVYHTNYLVWCEIGRTDFIRRSGSTYAELERRGVLLAVSEATIRYHAAARYDDTIRVDTTLTEVRSRAVTFDYVIVNEQTGERLASARTVLVSLDTSGRPTKLPDDFRRRLEDYLVAHSKSPA